MDEQDKSVATIMIPQKITDCLDIRNEALMSFILQFQYQ